MTALFFGSFNPVHVGHLIIAEYFAQQPSVEEVWLVVSPHNPHKPKRGLLDQYHRLDFVERAIANTPGVRASTVEFALPQPSYTTVTLAHLRELHPNREFALIMGLDNLESLPRWRNHEAILAHHRILVYPRLKVATPALMQHPQVQVMDAPVIELSSSHIREALAQGRSVRHMLPEGMYDYLVRERFYAD